MARGIGASDMEGGGSKPPSPPHSKSLARVPKARPQSCKPKRSELFALALPARLSQTIGRRSCGLIQPSDMWVMTRPAAGTCGHA